MHKSHAVEQCIETICHKGCARVWGEISALEMGEEVPETQGLNREEKAFVLSELKTIMAVYSDRCGIG